MPINLETPKKFEQLVGQAHQVAIEIFRANSRKYDRAEHSYPKELDMLAAVIDGMNEGGGISGAGAGTVGSGSNGASADEQQGNREQGPSRVHDARVPAPGGQGLGRGPSVEGAGDR